MLFKDDKTPADSILNFRWEDQVIHRRLGLFDELVEEGASGLTFCSSAAPSPLDSGL